MWIFRVSVLHSHLNTTLFLPSVSPPQYLLFNPILHGLFGGRERMGGGAESAHPLQNVFKAYLTYEIDVEQLLSAFLLDTHSLRGQNNHFG